MKKILCLYSVIMFCVSCSYDIGGSQGTVGGPGATQVSELNFANVYQTSIETSCFPCHQAPRNAAGVNLETYQSVFSSRTAVERAVGSRFMPDSQGRTMTDQQRNLLLNWLRAGAPEQAPAEGAQPPPAPPAGPQNPECPDDDQDDEPCDDRRLLPEEQDESVF